jgi:TPR repeat protein
MGAGLHCRQHFSEAVTLVHMLATRYHASRWFAVIACCLVLEATARGQVLTFEDAKQRAESGDAFAQAVVALHYQLGWNTEKNPELAVKYALASAKAGSPLGQFRLGALLRAGEGVPKDEQRGLALQASSFDGLDRMTGDPYALTSLGVMIFQGKAVWQNVPQEKRRQQAAELYRRAADAGFAPAHFNYAMCFEAGHGVVEDDALSRNHLFEAAKHAYPLAYSALRDKGLTRGGKGTYLPDYLLVPADTRVGETHASASGFDPHALAGRSVNQAPAWQYIFADPVSLINLTTGSVPGDIVYVDERWIIKEFVYGSSAVGYQGFDLYFIDAQTLQVKGQLQAPNALRRVIRTAPDSANFALLVESPGKFASAPTPAILLANPLAREIETVSLSEDGMWPQPFIDLDLSGREIKVLLTGRSFDPVLTSYAFKSGSFRGLSVTLHEVLTGAPLNKDLVECGKLQTILPAHEAAKPLHPAGSVSKYAWVRRDEWDGNDSRREIAVVDSSLNHDGQKRLKIVRSSVSGGLEILDLLTLRKSHLGLPEGVGAIESLSVDESGGIAAELTDKLWWTDTDGQRSIARPKGGGVFNARNSFVVKSSPPGAKWNHEWPDWRNEWMFIDGSGWQSDGLPSLSLRVLLHGPGKKVQEREITAPKAERLFPQDMYSKNVAGSRYWTYYNETGDNIMWERMDPERSSTLYGFKIVEADGKRWPTMFSTTAKPGDSNVILGEKADDWWVVAAQTHTTTATMPHSIYLLSRSKEAVYTLAEDVSGDVDLLEVYAAGQNEIQVVYAVGDLIKLVSLSAEDAKASLGKRVEKRSAVDTDMGVFDIIEDVLPLRELRMWRSANSGPPPLYAKSHRLLFIPKPSGYELFQLKASEPPHRVAQLYFGSGDEFAIVLPNGVYAGSPGCETALLQTIDPNSPLGAALLAPWRNRPAEVLKVLGGDSTQVSALEKVTQRWLQRMGHPEKSSEPQADDVPSIELAEEVPLWAQSDVLTMRFRARTGGRAPAGGVSGAVGSLPGGAKPSIKQVSVRVNGVAQAGALAVEGSDGEWLQEVKLAEGQNWIEASATDANGHSSNLLRFRVLLAESKEPARRYIIALGVSEYQESALNLAYAAKDAQDVAETMRRAGGDSQTLVLVNSAASKDSLAKIEEFLKPARENDEVVVFCAGHGVLDGNLDYVFASHDFDPDRPAETGIKLDDLIETIGKSKSLKRLLLLDTCHAGQVGEREEVLLAQLGSTLPKGVRAVQQRGMSVKPVEGLSAESQQRFIEEMFSLPGLHRGINVIGASGGAEFALESEKWNNGVFTAALIEALRDKKADANGDGRVGVAELRSYLADRVPKLTGGAQKPSVVAFERDQDFDLVN